MSSQKAKTLPAAAPVIVMDQRLPGWLKREGLTHYVIDPEKVYPKILEKLGVKRPTQYWVEICFLIARHLAHGIIKGSVTRIRFENRPAWALANFPPQEGTQLLGAGEDPEIAKAQILVNTRMAAKTWRQVFRSVNNPTDLGPRLGDRDAPVFLS